MNTFMSICLEKKGRIPIYKQLGDALLQLITEGVLKPDSKLPPIRKMADSLKINSSTVVSAYKYLESRHAVYSFPGSGTYVAPIRDGNSEISLSYKKAYADKLRPTNIWADFSRPRIPERLFPEKDVKKAAESAIEKSSGGFFSESDTEDCAELVREFSKRMKSDGINAEFFIADGISRALELVAETFITKGDYVILEKPVTFSRGCHYAERGGVILQTPLTSDGIKLDVFESLVKMYKPKVAHFSTYFQNPTGVCYSLENKKTILEICYKYGVIIIEEDVFSDLLRNKKRIFLKSLDFRGQVVFIKNMTETSFPWMNLWLCSFPKKYVAIAEKRLRHNETRISPQIRILTEMLITKSYGKAAHTIITAYDDAYQLLVRSLDQELSNEVSFETSETGTGIWIKMKSNESVRLAEMCARKGVLLAPGGLYLYDMDDCFRLSVNFGGEKTVRSAIRIVNGELTKLSE